MVGSYKFLPGLITLVIALQPCCGFSRGWSEPTEGHPSFRWGVTSSSLGLEFSDPQMSSRTKVKFAPNSPGRLALGAQYDIFSLTVGFTGETTPYLIESRGRTKGEDYQFRFFREQNSFDLFYQKYKGYFIENSLDVDSSLSSSDPMIQRSDLETEHIGIQYFRTLDPESFSMAACFDQSGWQKESGGTWFYYAAYDQHHFSADTALIPISIQSEYSQIADFSGGEFSTIKLGGGGSYVWVRNSFFVTGKIVLAGGQQIQKFKMNDKIQNQVLPTSGANLKVSFGYNGPSFFASTNVFVDGTNISIKDRLMSLNTVDVSLFMGLHL